MKQVSGGEASLLREALRAWALPLLRLHAAHGYDLIKRMRQRGSLPCRPRVHHLLRELEQRSASCVLAARVAGNRVRRTYSLPGKGTRRLHADAETYETLAENLQLFFKQYAHALRG